MTPEEFKARLRGKLISTYLAEPDKVLVTQAYQALSAPQRNAIQDLFENKNIYKAGKSLEQARMLLAGTMADAQIDVDLANGSIDLVTEIDKYLK